MSGVLGFSAAKSARKPGAALPDRGQGRRRVGAYWPYATTLFDHVRRAMPFDAPQLLTSHQTYAVCAYVLDLNGLLPETGVLGARTLPSVEIPDRSHFVIAFSPM